MAEKEEAKGEGEEAGAKGGKKKLLMIVGGVVLLAVIAVGAFLAGGGGKSAPKAEGEGGADAASAEGAAPAEGEGGEGVAAKPAILPLDPFIVNLQVKGSFLKATIQLEFAEPALPPTVEHDLPLIRDAIIQILSSKTASDILTTEGKQKLREEVRDAVNESLGSEDVVEVYFTEFIIQ